VFYLADVCGHDQSSVDLSMLLKRFSYKLRDRYTPSMLTKPGGVLDWLNTKMLSHKFDKHVAMFMGIVNATDRTLYYSNAGHFPSAILTSSTGAEFLDLIDRPLGIFAGMTYRTRSLKLPKRFALSILSDGILDILEAPDLKTKENLLLETFNDMPYSTEELLQRLSIGKDQTYPDDFSCLLLTDQQLRKNGKAR